MAKFFDLLYQNIFVEKWVIYEVLAIMLCNIWGRSMHFDDKMRHIQVSYNVLAACERYVQVNMSPALSHNSVVVKLGYRCQVTEGVHKQNAEFCHSFNSVPT